MYFKTISIFIALISLTNWVTDVQSSALRAKRHVTGGKLEGLDLDLGHGIVKRGLPEIPETENCEGGEEGGVEETSVSKKKVEKEEVEKSKSKKKYNDDEDDESCEEPERKRKPYYDEDDDSWGSGTNKYGKRGGYDDEEIVGKKSSVGTAVDLFGLKDVVGLGLGYGKGAGLKRGRRY